MLFGCGYTEIKKRKFSEVSRKLAVPEFTHQLAVKPTHIAVQLVVQAAPPKRGMYRPAIAALRFHTASGG